MPIEALVKPRSVAIAGTFPASDLRGADITVSALGRLSVTVSACQPRLAVRAIATDLSRGV